MNTEYYFADVKKILQNAYLQILQEKNDKLILIKLQKQT